MISEKRTACRTCIFRWKNFDNLNDEELELVEQNRTETNFKAGEIIFKQGSPTTSAIFISKGFGKIYIEGHDGKNLIIAIVKPGRLIAGPGAYVDGRHHYSFVALTDIHACFVNINTIKELVHKNSQFAEGYLMDVSLKSLYNFNKLISLTQKKMHGRLAEALLFLSNEIYQAHKFDCMLSRQELGEFSGMTKESVVRLLKELSDDGIIKTNNSYIEILDENRLKKIMSSG